MTSFHIVPDTFAIGEEGLIAITLLQNNTIINFGENYLEVLGVRYPFIQQEEVYHIENEENSLPEKLNDKILHETEESTALQQINDTVAQNYSKNKGKEVEIYTLREEQDKTVSKDIEKAELGSKEDTGSNNIEKTNSVKEKM